MEYLIHLAILFSIYVPLAVSLNLVVGYTGLLSLTHAAFYGIGAYVTTLLMINLGFGFFPALIIGMILAGVLAFLFGLVLSRFRDDYYALVSFGFNIIVYSILLNWIKLTNGALGISGIPRPQIFGFVFNSNFSFLLLSLAFALIVYLVSSYIAHSSFGRLLKGIREDEKVLAVFGYNTTLFKLTIFSLTATMAGLAGGLFATYIAFIDPSSFSLNESIFILVIIILGGMANLRGSIAGALFLILLPEILRLVGFPVDIAAQMRQVIYGVILVALMLYRPVGLMGEYKL
ncbi:MAG: branched-chain amino acid ABC transporter permease [bacterium]